MTNTDARQLSGPALAQALQDARTRTWALVSDLNDAQWLPPPQNGVNPVAWELGHLAWFAEFWVLRGPHHRTSAGLAEAAQPPRFAGPDAHLDSARLAHSSRWKTPLPSRSAVQTMLDGQLAACVDAIPDVEALSPAQADQALYLHRLALFHEDMHAEAFCWTRAALGYPVPPDLQAAFGHGLPVHPPGHTLQIPGAKLQTGVSASHPGFAFDNEFPSQAIELPAFEIDSHPVSSLQFKQFVAAGGYQSPDFWPGDAGIWLAQQGLKHPGHWRQDPANRDPGAWQIRWFDQWLPLLDAAPAIHLNAFEAEAWCLWADRRLPSAAQWELAATTEPGFSWGRSVWEWTASTFAPYPGFAPGPYQEYSQPWFGNHRELRGGAFATHARMHNPRYRNFFLPQRSDIFSGFRTIAP